jgi:hypothetical protein
MMMMGSPRERQEGIVTALRTESEVESALLISGFTSTTFQNTQGASSVASFPALNGSADVQTQVATYEVRASWSTHLSASVLALMSSLWSRVQIRAVKPNWEFGASAALSLPKSKPVSAAPVWSLSAGAYHWPRRLAYVL